MLNRNIALQLALACLIPAGASLLHAQQPQRPQEGTRTIAIAVVDPLDRYVSGIGREQFQVFENGVRVEQTSFMNSDAPAAIAIVGEPAPPTLKSVLGAQDELIEAASFEEAVQRIAASERRKKAIVVAGAAAPGSVPAGILVVQTDAASLQRAVVGVRNQYFVQFVPSDPSAKIELQFQQSSLLPVLKHTWKGPF